MINFTLTITAAPELLAALSTFTNSYSQSTPRANAYQLQNPTAHQTMETQQPQQQAPVQVAPKQGSAVPTSAQSYTMEQLAVASTQIVDAGRRTELVGLLDSFGVQALTALPKEQYGAFATQLRALGAKIDNLCVEKRNTEGSKI